MFEFQLGRQFADALIMDWKSITVPPVLGLM
jgi:hypothetical protein